VGAVHPLVEQVRSGQSRELLLLAAQGILPLPADELIPLQVDLTRHESWEISGYAKSALAETDPRVAATYLAGDASVEALEYFARTASDPRVLEVILRRRDTPRNLLAELAPGLGAELQEVLLLRQDAIIELPAILDALESNPELSLYSRRRILEYREHLLPRERQPEPLPPEIAGRLELDAADLAAIAAARELPASGEHDTTTGLSEGQVRSLPVPVKVKLTRGASRTLRAILVKDLNQMVALSVLNNSAMTEEEVEQIASSRSVVDEVLGEIARRREWNSKYNICLALVRNPRVPVGTAVRLVARLSVRDLRSLMRDRNVADAVRTAADRLYRIKTK